MATLRNISDEKLVAICRGFMDGLRFSEVAERCNALWQEQGSNFRITREQVYTALVVARRRGFFALSPPLNEVLGAKLAEKYGGQPSDIKVVAVRNSLEYVAEASARITRRLIEILAAQKPRVHLGIGSGATSMLFTRHLTHELRANAPCPPLQLHAISSGFDIESPELAAVSFFSYFESAGLGIRKTGLFAPSYVKASEYEALKRGHVVRESFEASRDVDIVVTSMASFADPHGGLSRFLSAGPGGRGSRKTASEILGDVQYNPYTARGPVAAPGGYRAVTLFDLEQLKQLAATPNKYVVLIAGPCGECGETRTRALRPLLENPELKVWTHLVTDFTTAEELAA